MKKSLLFTAAALMALSSFAETWKAETVFNYGVDKDGVSNPIPDIDGGIVSLGYWSAGQKTDPNLVCNQSNARFAVGLNGKIFTIDDKTNAIVAIDADGTKNMLIYLLVLQENGMAQLFQAMMQVISCTTIALPILLNL